MLFLVGSCLPSAAGDENLSDAFYLEKIKPLLQQKCVSCHGPVEQRAGLRLDAAKLIRQGGDSGAVVDAGDPSGSELLGRVTSEFAPMPPPEEGTELSEAQVELLRQWIAAGLPAPADEKILAQPKDHWAFQPIVRPTIPTAASDISDAEASPSNVGNPIDALLGPVLRRHALRPAPPADQATLLRRLTLDLIGLPPSAAQRAAFATADSAVQKRAFIDRLLANPAYGQRWGRHWMDVWRYSDWDGYKDNLRGSMRHIWRWRDWIVESLNEDKPYDRMITEMLAGDEIAPLDPDVVRATGFVARNFHKSNRNIWLNATVEHTAKAFLGLTLNCAQCHDHKFDPIAQEAFYEFRAIFEPHQARTDVVAGVIDTKDDGLARIYDADLDAETEFLIGGNEKLPDESKDIEPGVPEVLGVPLEIQPVTLPLRGRVPDLRPHVQRDQMAAADRRIAAARKAVAQCPDDSSGQAVTDAKLALALAQHASLDARWDADRAKYENDTAFPRLAGIAAARGHEAILAEAELNVAEKQQDLKTAQAAATQDTGDKNESAVPKKRKALRKAETQLNEARDAEVTNAEAKTADYESVVKAYPKTSSGRRTALAQWITDSRNPLTARVAVNHIWMRHFGAPLVNNVFDFGLRSPRPPHADVLDWLAAELIAGDWRMKPIHRLIVTSDAYQRASHANVADTRHNDAIDPDNRLLWRFNVIRLDAEVIRDSLLALPDELDRRFGGPEIDFRRGEDVYRRSLYFRHAYEKQMTMLTTFDAASPNECYRRKSSIVPQQALVMANGSLARSMSRRLAAKLRAKIAGGTDSPSDAPDCDNERFIGLAFQAVLSRLPRAGEIAACLDFLRAQTAALAAASEPATFPGNVTARTPPASTPEQRSRESLVHVLINHNDFVTVR